MRDHFIILPRFRKLERHLQPWMRQYKIRLFRLRKEQGCAHRSPREIPRNYWKCLDQPLALKVKYNSTSHICLYLGGKVSMGLTRKWKNRVKVKELKVFQGTCNALFSSLNSCNRWMPLQLSKPWQNNKMISQTLKA